MSTRSVTPVVEDIRLSAGPCRSLLALYIPLPTIFRGFCQTDRVAVLSRTFSAFFDSCYHTPDQKLKATGNTGIVSHRIREIETLGHPCKVYNLLAKDTLFHEQNARTRLIVASSKYTEVILW